MGRGRPRKTDPDTVLDTSMKVFWEHGFDGTSMNDLVTATGMAKPGLYATFGDKEALYTKALTRYVRDLGSPMLEDIKTSPDPIDVVVRRFLDSVATNVVDKNNPSGCFLANSVVECGGHSSSLEDIARGFDSERRAAFVDRFKAAKEKGELPEDTDAEALGEFFAGQALALSVMGRAGVDIATLSRFLDVAMQVLTTRKATPHS